MNLRLIGYGVVLAVVLSAGLYARSIYNKAQRVEGLETAVAELKARVESERELAQKSLELGHDLQKRLDDSRNRSAVLADRLRRALKVELSAPSPGAAATPGAGGNGSGTGAIDELDRVIAACQRDAIRLNTWIEYYRNAPAELK